MSNNQAPRSYDAIVIRLEEAADGAQSLGDTIGIKHNTAAAITATLHAITGVPGTPGARDLWNNAKAAKTAATGVLNDTKKKARATASACVDILKSRLGKQWNSAWQTAGFAADSIAIPTNPLTTLQQLRAYFTANPTHEKPDLAPGIHATAAACEAAAQTIAAANFASNESNTAAATARKNYYAALDAGRDRISGLREELSRLIAEDDERWYAFGFQRPTDFTTPEVPENLVVVPGNNGLLFLDWDDARRAESYRVMIKNPQGETIAERIVSESEAVIETPPAGNCTASVTARNAAGHESKPSDAIAFTVA